MQLAGSFLITLAVIGTTQAFNGDATFFDPGLGACGKYNSAQDLIVALSTPRYGDGSLCGKRIEVKYKGKSVRAKVVDQCPGCDPNDIDLSPAAFSKLANKDLGRIKVSWKFL